ncbi:hypothetical protein P7C71_g5078, partial [Lecanoromycetidae sp. Uapishka_2]
MAAQTVVDEEDVHYTVLIRLPFPRGDFVDPAPVNWDSAKERELWEVISNASSKGRELDSEIYADEEEEESPPFLPFSNARPVTPPVSTDPSATVKISPNRLAPHGPSPVLQENQGPPSKPKHPKLPQTAHSSSSSAQSQPQLQNRPTNNQLSALSPKQRRAAREGSDGTPSMGSSFSDLDDASVTQSALEEALANEMQHGGVASRMSTISQALRSRYL